MGCIGFSATSKNQHTPPEWAGTLLRAFFAVRTAKNARRRVLTKRVCEGTWFPHIPAGPPAEMQQHRVRQLHHLRPLSYYHPHDIARIGRLVRHAAPRYPQVIRTRWQGGFYLLIGIAARQ